VTQIEVSVVLPCLNEVESIASCVLAARAGLRAAKVSGEVVVADNGSTDGSIEAALSQGARVIAVASRGYGSALRSGIAAASGSFIIIGDADGTYDLAEAPRFIEKWREGYEVVMGNRFSGEIKPGAMPWHHRYIGNPFLSATVRFLFHTGVRDAHCGVRGFTKDAFDRMDLRTTGMEFASEFVIKAAWLDLRITEIPVTLWPDTPGRTPHLRSIPDGWRHLRFILMLTPNWLYIAPGGFLASIGAALIVWLVPGPRRVGTVVFDIHTLVVGMMLVLVGVQIITIGIFARVFSYSERFSTPRRSTDKLLRRVTLEQGLACGALLLLIGAIGDSVLFWRWADSRFGPFSELRPLIVFSLVGFLGIHVLFSSFFLSMLGVSRDTYIGEYERR
jgi:glycosyltransferase involved in cell wall biosynthesis